MTSDYASFGYLDDEPSAFARFPLAMGDHEGARRQRAPRAGRHLARVTR